MKTFRNRFAAWTAIAALGATSLFAAQTSAAGGNRHGRHGGFLKALGLTDAQQAQAKSIFQTEHQSAQPIREQLQQTRQSLRAAVQANNTAEIQQLAATQGSEVGQLTAIRSGAFAKLYQILTPDQQAKLATMHRHRGEVTQ
jgi:periplasmic protein CpxP/Spy